MAFLDAPINRDDLPESTGFEPLPIGEYQVTIRTAEICATKAGTGQYIKLQLAVTGPSHAGRVIFTNVNIRNPNPKAEEIGRRQLGDIMRAIGLPQLTDTDQLIGGDVTVKVDVRDDDTYGKSNEVKAFKAVNGSAAPSPKPSTQASQQAKPAASGGAAPPWAKR